MRSTEKAVSRKTPPTFIIHTSDDPIDPRNSLLFASALKANGIPPALHVSEKGGHGYGLEGDGGAGRRRERHGAGLA